MSTLKRQTNFCEVCSEIAGAFTCNGCLKTFCLHHTTKHRQALEEQMDEITKKHDDLKQKKPDEKIEKDRQKLMERIYEWEQQSIDKIQQTASEIRHQLVTITRHNYDNIKENLTQLTQQLTKARYDRDFFENDIEQWTSILQKLERDFNKQQNIKIRQVNNVTPFISKISLTGKSNYDTIMGMEDEYSFDDHTLRFKLEQYRPTSRVLIGIISKSTSKHIDPYKNPTFCGWGNHNLVYLHGVPHPNYNNYRSDIRQGDTFQLILDCDQHLIRLINERTDDTYEINVDITKCPFPWQPHVGISNRF